MPLNAQKIRELRERTGMTLDEAARKVGFKTRQQWYALENGGRRNVQSDTLLALSRALGVPMEELMKDEPKKPRRR